MLLRRAVTSDLVYRCVIIARYLEPLTLNHTTTVNLHTRPPSKSITAQGLPLRLRYRGLH